MSKYHHIILSTLLSGLMVGSLAAQKISFNKDIRPIFISKCTKCHGGVKADGDLSLLYREEALGTGKSGKKIIVPGKPEKSELYRRIITDDLDDKMPLQKGDHAEAPLKAAQIALIKQWIEEGAHWQDHWAYLSPAIQTTSKPSPQNKGWSRTGLDPYVLAGIEKNKLTPTAEAPKAQWIRRASLDITGLPPTLEELDAFEKDSSPQAYEKVVDRLLASPRYGERWAGMWMDLARYADSQGYEKDNGRTIWPYRDYLIDAFNKDKPYDQFLREQLAGDLFPNATAEQLIASAFHRNSQTNTEGGTNDEEFRVTAVIDRINTTWTVMQGFTFGCIQCHSHPYEPIPHENYYQFMDFFNSTEDHDIDSDAPHFIHANELAQREQAAELFRKIKQHKLTLNQPGKELMQKHPKGDWKLPTYNSMRSSHGKLENKNNIITHSGQTAIHTNHILNVKAENFTAIRVIIHPDENDPKKLPFKGSVLSQLIAQKITPDGKAHNIPLSYVYANNPIGFYDPQHTLKPNSQGIGGYPKLHKKREAVIITKAPVTFKPGEYLRLTLHQKASVTGNQPAHLRHYQLHFSNSPAWHQLLDSPEHKQHLARFNKSNQQYNAIKGTKIPIMQQLKPAGARNTRMFLRGDWQSKGEIVQPTVPSVLNPTKLKAGNRLEMASWISSPDNPLTARVFTNRIFSELFGRGIVETLGDFGSTGLAPTNQPLLDYLAVTFQTKHEWSLKALLKEMALSATYRQDHSASPEMAKRDPRNYMLSRGPRTRLSAEMIRDNALHVAGLLSAKMHGPSVMPPQPDGIWAGGYGGGKWVTAKGEDRYRRGLYTYWRRTVPYPSFITFDASSREVCLPQRIATNTPLHALTTLNDPVYYEAAQALAKRMQAHHKDLSHQITYGYKLATQKAPTPEALKHLTTLHQTLMTQSKDGDTSLALIANALLNLDAALTK